MIDPTHSFWIIANTYDWNSHKFHLTDPLEFTYSDPTIWSFLDTGEIVDRAGIGQGTWQIDAQQLLPNRLEVTVRTAAGGSTIEFIHDNFGIFYSAGQPVYFLAREAAFHLDW